MRIELHLLQNFPPACLNRDDTGQPKDCEFGGYRRARISSQCIKRSIRKDFKESNRLSEANLAVRTKRILRETARFLGKTEDEIREAVSTALESALPKKEGKKRILDGDDTQYLLFVGSEALKQFSESLDDSKKAGSALFAHQKAVDIALFGRMLADAPKANVNAACQVAHAISTNRVSMEFDYFTAADDLKDKAGGDDAGAGMIGTVGYNSSCFYRYSVINWDELVVNLGNDYDLARKAVEAFLHSSVAAIPTGKQNTFAAHSLPGFVLTVVRENGSPVNLANAFLSPVRPQSWGKESERYDLLAGSAEAISKHWDQLSKMYGTAGVKRMSACWLPEELPLRAFDECRTPDNSLDSVIATVMNGLPKGG